jgi:subtilisin family serine protease
MQYVTNGVRHEVSLEPMLVPLPNVRRPGAARGMVAPASADERGARFVSTLRAASVFASRFEALGQAPMFAVTTKAGRLSGGTALTIVTDTVTVEGVKLADITWARATFGAELLEEGEQGKKLLKVPRDANGGVERTFTLAEQLVERGVAVAHPNFIRALPRWPLSSADILEAQWAHTMLGVRDAWKTTMGQNVKVAVLDEGVDTSHPSLKAAVAAERDFIGGNGNSAMPSGNDAHGTACAGIIVSRDKTCQGVAPKASLIAARIAMDDGQGHWVFDDFATADAIDWCWQTGADVLSNSWGGGPPVDGITRAFERARTLGRNGLGAVTAIAAGNSQAPIQYPATIPGVLAVGASNQFDERKTRTSQDGETRWGSCYGPALALLAPGVRIFTTDISGPAGYDPGDFTRTFNGTSAATPHVAAAAALVLSVASGLRAAQVREIIMQTAQKLKGQTAWTPELGHGRLNIAKAVAAASAPPPSPTIVAGLTPARSGQRKRRAKRAAPARRRR